MRLDDLTDPQRKTRQMRKAIARGDTARAVKHISKEKAVEREKGMKSEPAGCDVDSSEFEVGATDFISETTLCASKKHALHRNHHQFEMKWVRGDEEASDDNYSK